jgi:hypothetical protein
MGQPKTLAEMTPEERQKLLDDFCGFEPLKQAVQDTFRAIVTAFNSFPPELLEALVAAQASGEKLELPEPDQIIHRDGSTQGSES